MKTLRLITGILFLTFSTVLNTFAITPSESYKFDCQFASLDLNQINWDYAAINYTMIDNNSGEFLKIPSCLVKYEVKDKVGKVVSSGNGVYISIADERLGSEEDYTIVVSTTINGNVVSRSLCKKASPKKLEMTLDTKNGNLKAFNANSFSYTYTRPVYNNPSLFENVSLSSAEVFADVSISNCIGCENFRVDFSKEISMKKLSEAMKQLTKQGESVQLTISPTMVYKGESYKDENLYFDVSKNSIKEATATFTTASK